MFLKIEFLEIFWLVWRRAALIKLELVFHLNRICKAVLANSITVEYE
jgi:hypothetical protein